jgi:hypothetical protein
MVNVLWYVYFMEFQSQTTLWYCFVKILFHNKLLINLETQNLNLETQDQ